MVCPEIAGFLLSPIIGAVLERFGRKNVIMSGSIIVALAQALLGLTHFIKNDTMYFIAACFCRFLSGAGDQQV
jgi:MFS family permease